MEPKQTDESLGEHKRLNCKYNIEGVCRWWCYNYSQDVPGVEMVQLDGKYYPRVIDSFCAPCTVFETVPST